ncbi:hypothetical protein BDZ91DRAFT_682722 [Kalaharituber pfeilii]|nr:hypothetical protein BDZ91DRAFT_682722 [Kalaharituber pfeilii]
MASLRHLLAVMLLALTLHVYAASLPHKRNACPSKPKCKSPLIRKEWRRLSKQEKKSYIDAVKCLQRLPSKSDSLLIPGARTRYDDFHAVHITHSHGLIEGTGGIHLVGHFLPWHRYFMIAYEKALREECGYKGAQPYWNWTLDSGPGKDVRDSPVFDPITGFGGNGKVGPSALNITASRPFIEGGTGGGCVVDGPFKDMKLNVGPGPIVTLNTRCLSRSINPTLANNFLSYDQNIKPLWNAKKYKEFAVLTEGDQKLGQAPIITFHGAGHYVAGGEAEDFISSNAEPLFYLHHTFVDALWLKWQNMDKSGKRFKEIGGPILPWTTTPEVTLNFPIDLGACGATINIRDVMNVQKGNRGGIGCYEYEW